MARSGLLTAEARAAGPNDLVVVIRAASAADAERVVRGGERADSTLAALDRDVTRLLEKRRWLLTRARPGAAP